MTTPDVDLPEADPPALDVSAPDDVALLCYTSGTTGAPKGAMLTHGNALASCEALRLAWRWSAADRLVLALPLFHVHGLGVGLHGTLLCGGSAVLLPRFDADAVLDAARDHDATLFFGVPTMYPRLAASARRGRARPSAVVRVGFGAPAGRAARRPHRPGGDPRPRAVRHDRDDHERVEPLRRRAPGRHRGLSAPRRRGAARRAVRRDPAARPERVPRVLGSGGGDP